VGNLGFIVADVRIAVAQAVFAGMGQSGKGSVDFPDALRNYHFGCDLHAQLQTCGNDWVTSHELLLLVFPARYPPIGRA